MSGRKPVIIRVGLDLPVRRLFDYLPAAEPPPPPGSRVRVSCAGRVHCGIVAAHASESQLPVKRLLPIEEKLGGPTLPVDLLACVAAAARNFLLPPGRLLLRCLPHSLRLPRPAADLQIAAVTFAGRPPALPAKTRRRLAEIVADASCQPLLVSGPTGSGKADLLIALAAQHLADGGQVLLLAPTAAAAACWQNGWPAACLRPRWCNCTRLSGGPSFRPTGWLRQPARRMSWWACAARYSRRCRIWP